MSWSLESPEPERLRVASQLGMHLGRFWWVNLLSKDGKEFLTALLSQPTLAQHIPLDQQVRLHNSLISQEVAAGNDDAVMFWCNKALALAQNLDAPKLRGIILANLGLTIMRNQDWDEKNPYLQEAIQIFKDSNDYPRLISIYHNMSLFALIHEKSSLESKFLKTEIEISNSKGHKSDIHQSTQSCANFLLVNNHYRQSIKYYQLSIPKILSNNHFFAIIGALSCYFIAEYLCFSNPSTFEKILFLNQYRKNLGIHEGYVSKIILDRHRLTLHPVTLPSPDLAREMILRWAAEVAPDVDIPYEELVHEMLAVL